MANQGGFPPCTVWPLFLRRPLTPEPTWKATTPASRYACAGCHSVASICLLLCHAVLLLEAYCLHVHLQHPASRIVLRVSAG